MAARAAAGSLLATTDDSVDAIDNSLAAVALLAWMARQRVTRAPSHLATTVVPMFNPSGVRPVPWTERVSSFAVWGVRCHGW